LGLAEAKHDSPVLWALIQAMALSVTPEEGTIYYQFLTVGFFNKQSADGI
jgi:hypothetical protein